MKLTGPPGSRFARTDALFYGGRSIRYRSGPIRDAANRRKKLLHGLTSTVTEAMLPGGADEDKAAMAMMLAGVHEALEWLRVDGKLWVNPHDPRVHRDVETVVGHLTRLLVARRQQTMMVKQAALRHGKFTQFRKDIKNMKMRSLRARP